MLVRLGLGEGGRLTATGLLIEADDGELTASALRLPLAGIVEEFAAAASKPTTYKRLYAELIGHPEFARDRGWQGWRPEASGDLLAGLAVDFLDVQTRADQVPVARPGRRGHSDEHYRRIARAYTMAKRKYPKAPIRKLMQATGKPEATVHRWIRIARERGFLKDD